VGHYKELIVSGDTLGHVRLHGYPCINAKSECYEEKPVSGPVTCARFFADDSCVIAVGGVEGAMFKFKIK